MSKTVHCYEESGAYVGSHPIEPDQYSGEYNHPSDSTEIAPPSDADSRKVYFRDGVWHYEQI